MDLENYAFDKEGNPISFREWSELRHDPDYHRVALTEIGEISISTVWLGINHGISEDEPIIFETMVFGGSLEQEQWRYTTEAEALEGHNKAVELVKLEEAVKAS